jgi:hypothetical protein
MAAAASHHPRRVRTRCSIPPNDLASAAVPIAPARGKCRRPNDWVLERSAESGSDGVLGFLLAPGAELLSGGTGCRRARRSRIGRRPLLAAVNSHGDVPMLHFTEHKDKLSLRHLVLHDDGEREFDYTAGAEQGEDEIAMVLGLEPDTTSAPNPTSGRQPPAKDPSAETRLNSRRRP